MFDTPATRNVERARLLGLATAAQQGLDLDDPADSYYRKGVRDAYAFAAALLGIGAPGDVTRVAADRVTDLLGEGITDLGLLMVASESGPRPQRDSRTWVGTIAFNRLTATQPGTDHDHGTRWGPRGDTRLSHRRAHDADSGLLYAYDRTWDEYAVLADDIGTDVVEAITAIARARDPRLPADGFLGLLREARARHAPDATTVDTGLVRP